MIFWQKCDKIRLFLSLTSFLEVSHSGQLHTLGKRESGNGFVGSNPSTSAFFGVEVSPSGYGNGFENRRGFPAVGSSPTTSAKPQDKLPAQHNPV